MDRGHVHTRGNSFRARAEARQREYRADFLKAGWSSWGHWLDSRAVEEGQNFVTPDAHEAARARRAQGKGVDKRTFENMLASQAMCFNIFTPLARDTEVATAILRPMIPGLARVLKITVEYTPPSDVFGDQSGRSGVDCDLLVDAEWSDGERAIIVIETKFVETEFSRCGFRKGRAAPCPSDVEVRLDPTTCLYSSRKTFLYWDRTLEHGNIARESLPVVGCPFGGALWQLWVNHTLAHVEARRRGARHARFAVLAPAANEQLLRSGAVLEDFRRFLADPETLLALDLDTIIRSIARRADLDPKYRPWSDGIAGRYGGI